MSDQVTTEGLGGEEVMLADDARRLRLVRAREYAKYDSASAAAEAFRDHGWKASTYRAHENGGRNLSRKAAIKYADGFGVSLEWLWSGKGQMALPQGSATTNTKLPQVPPISPQARPNAVAAHAGLTYVSPRQIDVLGHAMAGDGGAIIMDGTVAGHAPCPASLGDIDGAYAVYVTGESMEPRFFAGETVFVHPYRPPKRGDFVVLQARGDDHALGYVKRFISSDASEVVVCQYNPEQELRFPRSKVIAVHLIVATSSL